MPLHIDLNEHENEDTVSLSGFFSGVQASQETGLNQHTGKVVISVEGEVTKHYLIGLLGRQIDKLGASLFLRRYTLRHTLENGAPVSLREIVDLTGVTPNNVFHTATFS